jgi:hypothetical protein
MSIPDPPNGYRIIKPPYYALGKLHLYRLYDGGDEWISCQKGLSGQITVGNSTRYAEAIPETTDREW